MITTALVSITHPIGSIAKYCDTEFNAGIRAYFTDTTDREDTPVVWLDATLDPAKLLKIAEVHIRELLLARES
jgi:hypothetical protein